MAEAATPPVVVGRDVDAGAVVVLRPALSARDFADAGALRAALDAAAPPALGPCLDAAPVVTVLAAPGWVEAWSIGAPPATLELAPSERAGALCEAEKLGCAWRRFVSRAADPGLDAALHRRGPRATRALDAAMADVARAWHDTLVVPGVWLPTPTVAQGRLVPGAGAPQPVVIVWGPDGDVRAVTTDPASPEAPARTPAITDGVAVWAGPGPTAADLDLVEARGAHTVVAAGRVDDAAWADLAARGVRLGVATEPPSWLAPDARVAPVPAGPWCAWAPHPPPPPEAEEAWEASFAPTRPARRR